MPQEFVGQSLALSPAGLEAAAGSLGIGAAELWTVMAVETSGFGFLPDRRPPILYERHIFHRLTGGRFDDGDISNAAPGGYGPRGAAQYVRLSRAAALDRTAALESASWGLGQVMGMNCTMAGYPDVSTMVAAMAASEDAQLSAVAAFVKSAKLDGPLQNHDWAGFAKGYNGPGFAQNQYDVKLAAAYQRLTSGDLPDLDVRTAQLYLTFRGFDPGPVDGMMGVRTRQAIVAFQASQGLPPNGVVNEDLLAALRPPAD